MANISLVVGANKLDRIIKDAELYLTQYRNDTGYLYQNYQMITSPDRVVPEGLVVTLLMNSQVGWMAFQTLYEQGQMIDLSHLPNKPLEQTSREERNQVASVIARMAQLPGFASSVATKVLHKKRPYLIPVLDNQAIYGAYMYKLWPQKPARTDSIKDQTTICAALDWITTISTDQRIQLRGKICRLWNLSILAFSSLTVSGGCIFEKSNPLYNRKQWWDLKKAMNEKIGMINELQLV
jgi:hypothetical protein